MFNKYSMNKQDLKKQANKIIDDAASKIEELKSKKESLEGQAKSTYDETIKNLEAKKAEMEAKYAELEQASDEKLKEIGKVFSSASSSFEEGFTKIKSLFS